MYLKISISGDNLIKHSNIFSSNLLKDEKIKNIEVMDDENLLILIENGEDVKGAIYNVKKNQIIRFIDK